MIKAEALSKHFDVYEREAGFLGSLRALFRRETSVVKAVDGISFEIAEGEMVGLLGANGAGKTTTLKLLSGLLHPSGGELSVAGFAPKRRQREFLSRIAFVMGHKEQLTWDLTAADSFLVNQAIYDIPDGVYRQRLAELIELLALDGLLDRQVRKLSLGERMKCELAAALLHQPSVLFLDEPTLGLDVNTQRAIRSFIAAYNRRLGATVILTSHYMADVTALVERVVVIDEGQILFDGRLRDLAARLAPRKILRLQLLQPQSEDSLGRFAELRSCEDLEVEFLVERDAVAQVTALLLEALPVADIAIEEVPIEDVIGQLFQSGDKLLATPGTAAP